jgi:hypothetical protein
MKVGFGAAQARRLLAAVEINNRIGADRPIAVVHMRDRIAGDQSLRKAS